MYIIIYFIFSVFGRIELPELAKNFKKGLVKALNVYVTRDLDTKPK